VEQLLAMVKHLPPGQRSARVEAIVDAAQADAPRGLMMNQTQLRSLAAAGMTLGGHTRRHPILRSLSDDEARVEIEGGRNDLANIIGCAPSLFAYPNGRLGHDYEVRHVALVRDAGFEFAFTTSAGGSGRRTDPYQLRRFTPWDRSRARFSARALRNLLASGTAGGSNCHAER
jgi:peptidoglycan/xylan/chitin deacetylase (PgdA/CDA1 family)